MCRQITERFVCDKAANSNLKLGNKADMTSSSKQTWESPASAVQSPDIDPTLGKLPLSAANSALKGRKSLFKAVNGPTIWLQSRRLAQILCSKMRKPVCTGTRVNTVLISRSIKHQSKPYYPRPVLVARTSTGELVCWFSLQVLASMETAFAHHGAGRRRGLTGRLDGRVCMLSS